MVIGLHLPFHSSPLDGMSAKSSSLDSGMFQSLSFEKILKAKEKQLQQEQSVSASSVAAALANLHTLFITKPSIPEIETVDNSSKIDRLPGPQVTDSSLTSHPIDSPTSLDGLAQPEMNKLLTADQPLPSQMAAQLSVPNELAVSVSKTAQNTIAGLPEAIAIQPVVVEGAQLPAMNFSKPEIPIHKNALNQTMNIAEKSAVKTESTAARINNIASELVSSKTKTQMEAPVVDAKNIVPQVPTTEATIETPNTTAAVNTKNEVESAQVGIKSQSSANAKTFAQTLVSNHLPSQAETKDVKPKQTISPQLVEVAELPTSKTIISESNVKDAIDKSVLPFSPQAEVSPETSSPASPVRVKVNQGSQPLASEQAERLINTPVVEIQTLDATPVQESATQAADRKESVSASSRQKEQSVSGLVSTVEGANVAPVQHSSPQWITDQDPNRLSSEQGEINNTLASVVESSNEAFVQDSSNVESQAKGSINSEQVAAPDGMPVQDLSHQPDTAQEPILFTSKSFEDSANPDIAQFAESGHTFLEPSVNQTEVKQETNSPTSNQVDRSIDTSLPTVQDSDGIPTLRSNSHSSSDEGIPTSLSEQLENPTVVNASAVEVPEEKVAEFSTEQSAIDSGSVTRSPRQDTVSSQTATTETAESKAEIEMPDSAFASAVKKAEIKAENAIAPTVLQADAPVTNEFRPANDPLPVLTEIAANIKTTEVQTAKVESADFVSQIKTQVNQNIGNAQVRLSTQPQQSEELNIEAQRTEKAIPQVSVQSEIKIPLSRVETDGENFVIQTKNPETETTTSQPNTTRNHEAYHAQPSEQIRQDSPRVSIPSTRIDQEVRGVVIQPVRESVDAFIAGDLPEISSSSEVQYSETKVKDQSTKINDNSTITPLSDIPVNQVGNFEKAVVTTEEAVRLPSLTDSKAETPITHRAGNPDVAVTDISQTTPEVDSDTAKAGQETIHGQVSVTVANDGFSLPTQDDKVESKSFTEKNIGAKQFVSQFDIQASADETQQAPAISETLVSKEVKTSKEVVDQVKPVENQTVKTVALPAEALTNENVSESLASENPVVAPHTNTESSTVIKEESVALSSTQFDLPASNFVEPTQDIGIFNESKQVLSQTNAVPGVAQPRIDLHNISKDSLVIETADHLNTANTTGTTRTFETQSSWMQATESTNEDTGLQQPIPPRQSASQNQSMDINSSMGTQPTLTEVESKTPLAEETTHILNKSVNDVVNSPVHTGREADAVESKPVGLGKNATPQEKTVPLPEQTFISDTNGVDHPVQIDELFLQNGRMDVDVRTENHDVVAGSKAVIRRESKTPARASIEEAVANLDNSMIDKADVPAKTVSEGLALSSMITEQSVDTVSEIAGDVPTIDVNADLVKGKAQTAANEKDILTGRPAIQGMQAQVDMNRPPVIESKNNPLEASVTTSSNEVAQAKFEVAVNSSKKPTTSVASEASGVETQFAGTSEDTAIAANKPKSTTRQIETETESQQVAFDTKSTLLQHEPDKSSVESQQPILGAAIAEETASVSQRDEKIDDSAVSQETVNESLLQSADNLQAPQSTDNHQVSNLESLSMEPQVSSIEFVETLPLNFDHPVEAVIANQTSTQDVKTENPATQPVVQGTISADLGPDVPSVTLTGEIVETKNVERRVHTDAVETAQHATNAAEKKTVKSDAGVIKNADGAIFVETNENVNNIDSRTIFVNESNIAVSQESFSAVRNREIPAASQSGASIKVESNTATLKNKSTVSKDEELLPLEKHSSQDQTLEAAPTTTGPVKETLNTGFNGKALIDQVNAQAAEVAQQVIHQMSVKIKNGPTSMHLQLNPKELGNIDVEMVSTAQGVRVTFFTEQVSTGKLLETQLSQLRETLIDSGVQLSGLNISQHGLSEQKGGFFSQDKNFTQYSQGDVAWSEPNITETLPTERNTGKSGEVDYRI